MKTTQQNKSLNGIFKDNILGDRNNMTLLSLASIPKDLKAYGKTALVATLKAESQCLVQLDLINMTGCKNYR